MATASECLECKATPATVPLPCTAHFVCHECLVTLVAKQLAIGENSAKVLKCPACHGAEGVGTTESELENRTYKDVLTYVKPKPPPPASHLSDDQVTLATDDESSAGKLPGIWIFVHQSNMWIEAKKLYGRQKGFKSDQDHRVRIDMGKLADVLAGGREEVKGKLYGSEPPPIDTVWKKNP